MTNLGLMKFLEEIKLNYLMSKKYKKVCKALNYFYHFLVFVSAVTVYLSILAFASLVGIPVGFTSSAVGLKICAITAGIKKYKVKCKDKEDEA